MWKHLLIFLGFVFSFHGTARTNRSRWSGTTAFPSKLIVLTPKLNQCCHVMVYKSKQNQKRTHLLLLFLFLFWRLYFSRTLIIDVGEVLRRMRHGVSFISFIVIVFRVSSSESYKQHRNARKIFKKVSYGPCYEKPTVCQLKTSRNGELVSQWAFF